MLTKPMCQVIDKMFKDGFTIRVYYRDMLGGEVVDRVEMGCTDILTKFHDPYTMIRINHRTYLALKRRALLKSISPNEWALVDTLPPYVHEALDQFEDFWF